MQILMSGIETDIGNAGTSGSKCNMADASACILHMKEWYGMRQNVSYEKQLSIQIKTLYSKKVHLNFESQYKLLNPTSIYLSLPKVKNTYNTTPKSIFFFVVCNY